MGDQHNAQAALPADALLTLLQQQGALMAQMMQQQQQPNAVAQLVTLQALGQLQSFHGRPDVAGLVAREWLMHAEIHFAAAEHALGVTAADADVRRVMLARNALKDDALRWLMALPQQPTTWQAFNEAFLARFSSLPAAQVREAQLHKMVEAAKPVRERLNADGIQRYTTLFLQRAGEIAADRMTDATKRMLYAQGLPAQYAEFVRREDARPVAVPLYELAQLVLTRATLKSYTGASAMLSSHAPASSGNDPMQVDSVSLASAAFGVSREEATSYLEPSEGWAVHDTAQSPSTTEKETSFRQQLAAMQESLAAMAHWRGGARTDAPGSKPRYTKTPGVTDEQIQERRTKRLCFACGSPDHQKRDCSKKPAPTPSWRGGPASSSGN